MYNSLCSDFDCLCLCDSAAYTELCVLNCLPKMEKIVSGIVLLVVLLKYFTLCELLGSYHTGFYAVLSGLHVFMFLAVVIFHYFGACTEQDVCCLQVQSA